MTPLREVAKEEQMWQWMVLVIRSYGLETLKQSFRVTSQQGDARSWEQKIRPG